MSDTPDRMMERAREIANFIDLTNIPKAREAIALAIRTARAEGAREEREAIAQIAADQIVRETERPRPLHATNGKEAAQEIYWAIRARTQETP